MNNLLRNYTGGGDKRPLVLAQPEVELVGSDRDGRARGLQPQRDDARDVRDVFESWIVAGMPRFTAVGLDDATARELVIGMICALEGAFVAARATRSTGALHVAGELVAGSVKTHCASAGPGHRPRRARSRDRVARRCRARASP